MMVHFFGILSPSFAKRGEADEAPNKTDFFGGVPDYAFGAVPVSRIEHGACYLDGKAPEPDPLEVALERPYRSMATLIF